MKKKHKIDVLPNQIRQHLLFASWISGFKNLKFDSQTKERVTNPASDSAPIYEGIDFEKIAKSIINTPEIIDPMIAAILYKKELAAAAELRKLNKDADRANLRKIVKFTDASQKNKREECMLFITEGDSANAAILSARTQQIGSYPLRGKPLNALATDTKDLLANKEFADLISIVGHKVNHKIKSVDDLRFGKIVICTDADADGSHIRGLVLALYKKFWPEVFEMGLLYIFTTPLVKVTVGKEDLLFYSLDEFSAWEKKNAGKKYSSRYLKGLGSSTAKDFKRYFAEMDKNLKQVKLEDVKDLELFDLVFGKEAGMTDKRWWKEFFFEIRWYLFLERYPKKYIGHNPVGQIAMASFLWITLFMCVTGFALYGEGTGAGSWAHSAFGWVIGAFGSSLDVHNWHRLAMWGIVLFVMVHVYAAIREDIMSKQSMISTMVSGFRMFKD
jgi:DNA gyrase/topoisomerase IV subunit B